MNTDSVILTPSPSGNDDLLQLQVSTAKNAVLPLMVAAMLNPGQSQLRTTNAFKLTDVDAMAELLKTCGIGFEMKDASIQIDARAAKNVRLPAYYAERTRYSLLLLGALVARFGTACIPHPGGCELDRPHDYHLTVLRSLGCTVTDKNGEIQATRVQPANSSTTLPYPSVGATINAILCASTSPIVSGTTITLKNCAAEPEIDDILNFLALLGVNSTRNWRTIVIEPIRFFAPRAIEFQPIADRIEAGSYAFAAAILGVKAIILNAPLSLMNSVLAPLVQLGCQVDFFDNALIVDARGIDRNIGFHITTEPYPGFPTDLQPILAALCVGQSVPCTINDTVMPKRIQYLDAFRELGVSVDVHESKITVSPPHIERPQHARNPIRVTASDLRGGMAAILLALGRRIPCQIDNFAQVQRGYSQIEHIIGTLGGTLTRSS